MEDLWKYRWKSLGVFWVFYAMTMLSDGKIFFASLCGSVVSVMIMVIILYSHEKKSLFSKISICGILLLGLSVAVLIIHTMITKL